MFSFHDELPKGEIVYRTKPVVGRESLKEFKKVHKIWIKDESLSMFARTLEDGKHEYALVREEGFKNV